MTEEQHPVPLRRTFAIISHPDAGKTTLTEKLLLFGGAIQMAGRVKARGQQRLARSDWMKVEQERGISVTVSVMTYHYQGLTFNLLDTPGHADFSEDTYRTLTAVDSAIMVIDAAKGIEAQTLKLFEVCRLRNVPIITFINKMDRDGRDPFDLMSEIEEQLALEATPATWPIGVGRDFLGCYDLRADQLLFMDRSDGREVLDGVTCNGLQDNKIDQLIPSGAAKTLREEVEMVRGLCPAFNLTSYRQGHMTPVFFGSAINNFGVRELLQGVLELAPA
ncbi:GTP-binding protein, partial [Candidatus Magnetaquicoccus inordinatus]|uniref:GTP-binding protein n=1 Tax=Candidatus Magnetaquicoccus inordinatus TaxID=2496818 RepID=UPI00102CE2A6